MDLFYFGIGLIIGGLIQIPLLLMGASDAPIYYILIGIVACVAARLSTPKVKKE